MKNLPHVAVQSLLLAWIFSAGGLAQEWTRFRGPNGTGISTTTGVPVSWTTADFRWRLPIPGASHSQPVIWGDRIFVMTASNDSENRMLLCLQKKDGAELWRKTYQLPTRTKGNKRSSYANGSPVVDAMRVIACFVSTEHFWVRSFNHAGDELWSRDLGPFPTRHGHGGSPIIYGSMVIVNNDQDNESFVTALDLETGKPLWKLPGGSRYDFNTYGTPIVHAPPAAPAEIILGTQSRGLVSLDPKTGALNWEAAVVENRMIGSPVLAGDLVIGAWGFGANNVLGAVKLGGKGNVSKTNVAYTARKGVSYVPTPLYHDSRLYVVNDGGIMTVLEAATGREIWAERLAVGEFYSSPVLIDGKIYVASVAGEMFVLAAGDEFKLLARNPLGEGTHSTPCVDAGRLYQKTFTHLACIGEKG